MEKLRIVFMGTPDFAVGILDSIIKSHYEVVGVITAADKPAGRGQKIKYSAVKEYALENGLTLMQPTNLKDEAFIAALKSLNANLHVVVAFRMLPKVVWEMPKLGTFNLHASLLPNYRGAAPINWAIINGEEKTGVTTFFIDDKIDTGAMILKKELTIASDENAGQLHDRLMDLGAEAVIETLQLISNHKVQLTVQEEDADLKMAYKLHKDNCKIDWESTGNTIYNFIRGLSPYPAAWFTLKDEGQEWMVKVFESKWIAEKNDLPLGTIISTKSTLQVAVADGYVALLELQLSGKKRMKTKELLNGVSFSATAMAF